MPVKVVLANSAGAESANESSPIPVQAAKPAAAILTNTPWHDEDQAAAYTGFATSTIQTYRSRGGGPKFYKRGKSVRYHRDDLDAWIRELGPQ